MDYCVINDDIVEIIPGEHSPEKVLEEIARLSYELAESPAPSFIQPFDVPVQAVDFQDFIGPEGLRIDYLNGRLCSTYVERKDNRLLFDARSFRQDRGSVEAFLALLKYRLEISSGEEEHA
ncbi:MAG: hypothetical protein JRI84_13770 [Deltaproteobacteria bacterium]|nr:hypothetical protein [Deltaproteobacteria bacterium]MBW1936592.1 hypothetical protein [Deltaproteobacteria bacterium]